MVSPTRAWALYIITTAYFNFPASLPPVSLLRNHHLKNRVDDTLLNEALAILTAVNERYIDQPVPDFGPAEAEVGAEVGAEDTAPHLGSAASVAEASERAGTATDAAAKAGGGGGEGNGGTVGGGDEIFWKYVMGPAITKEETEAYLSNYLAENQLTEKVATTQPNSQAISHL